MSSPDAFGCICVLLQLEVPVDCRLSRANWYQAFGRRTPLREVLAEHDLRRWMFTDLVVIDETLPRRRQPPADHQARLPGEQCRRGAEHVRA
jgi:hypothetical protein